MKKLIYSLSALVIFGISFISFPEIDISNGIIKAKIYPPDASKGYYQGTRFDWSGNIPVLEYKGHTFFGQWFAKYSPEIHDAIMGPVEDFAPLNFTEAKPGESYVKVGIGELIKPDDKPYTFSRLYQLVNPGKWTVTSQPDRVSFIHDLNGTAYSYHYEKVVQLTKDKPEMVITHIIKNTGTRSIETTVYDHNFFVIDKQPIGPGIVIKFPYNIKGTGRGFGDPAEISGNKISFLRNLKSDETVFCGGLEGFGTNAADYDIRIENQISGAGVRITSDQPLLKLVFWACATTACPEPYIKIKADPGMEYSWRIVYEFYTLPTPVDPK